VWNNDSNGATSGATVVLIVSADPTISAPGATRSTLDIGQITHLTTTQTNGTGLSSTYAWQGLPAGCTSTSAKTLACTPTGTGTYSVTVSITDSNGYTVTSGPVTLVISPALGTPPLSASVSALDVGQPITFSVTPAGGSGSYLFAWSGVPRGCVSVDSVSLTCVPSTNGTYSTAVTITDTNGVSVTSSPLTITVSPALAIRSFAVSSGTADLGQNVTFSVAAMGGAGPLNYTWSGLPSGCASAASSFSCTPTAVGTFSVSVRVSDGNGGHVFGSEALVVSPALVTPAVSLSRPSLDVGQSLTMLATVSGGSEPFSYSWSGLPAGCLGATSSIMCSPTKAGTFTVQVKVVDSNGQTVTSPAQSVTVDPPLAVTSVQVNRSVIDVGMSAQFHEYATGGSGGLTYAWTGLPAGCSPANASTLTCRPTQSGSYWVWVVVSDPNGETATAPQVILEVSPPLGTPIVFSNSRYLMVGDTVEFTASVTGGAAPLSYSWSDLPSGCLTADSPTLTCAVGTAGTYTVSVTVADAAGASVSASAPSVTVKSVPAQGFASGANGLEWTLLGVVAILILLGVVGLLLLLRKRGSSPPATDASVTKETTEREATPVSSSSDEVPTPKVSEIGKDET
jgi:hypothetical protein